MVLFKQQRKKLMLAAVGNIQKHRLHSHFLGIVFISSQLNIKVYESG